MQVLLISFMVAVALTGVTATTVEELKRIFQTPAKRNYDGVLERGGFAEDPEEVDEAKSFANAQVMLRFGSCGCANPCSCPQVPLVYQPIPCTLPYFPPSGSCNDNGRIIKEIDNDNSDTSQINVVNNVNSNLLGVQVNNQNGDLTNQQIDASTPNNLWGRQNLFQPDSPDNPIAKTFEKIVSQLVKDIAENLVRDKYQLSKQRIFGRRSRKQLDLGDLFHPDNIDNPIIKTIDNLGPIIIETILSKIRNNQKLRLQNNNNKQIENIINNNVHVNNNENIDIQNQINKIKKSPNLLDLFHPDNSQNPIIRTFAHLTTKFIDDINNKLSRNQNFNFEKNLFHPKNSQNPIVLTFEKIGKNFLKHVTEKLLDIQRKPDDDQNSNVGSNWGRQNGNTIEDNVIQLVQQNQYQNTYVPFVDSRPGEGVKLLVSYPFYPDTPSYNPIDSLRKPLPNGQNLLDLTNINFGQPNDKVEYVCFPVDQQQEESVQKPFLSNIAKKLQQSFLEPTGRLPGLDSHALSCNCRYIGELNQNALF